MKKTMKITAALAMMILAGSTSTQALPVSLGDPFPSQSWSWNFYDTGFATVTIDKLELWQITGSTLETPALTGGDFASGTVAGTGAYAVWNAPAPDNYITGYLNLNGSITAPSSYYYLTTLSGIGGGIGDYGMLTYNGNSNPGGLNYSSVGGGWWWADYANNHLPDPTQLPRVPDAGMTAMLLGMSMLAVGWVRRMVK